MTFADFNLRLTVPLCFDSAWIILPETKDTKDRKVMTAFYNYSEPFSCKCRAFGRLQETSHENLAVDCFGCWTKTTSMSCTVSSQIISSTETRAISTAMMPTKKTTCAGAFSAGTLESKPPSPGIQDALLWVVFVLSRSRGARHKTS